ncbi:universal stress protein [Naasia sp. SYSU D00057]|uniref:universal stress protein n=1 Tax=Naasia sp. SYSU D00057 TaxID=2817380 RepID=UPI001B312CCF|nr:universal stress protein [Naasia sp. SYSU D00057]
MVNGTALAAEQAASGAAVDPLIPPGGRYLVGFDGSNAARLALDWTVARARRVMRRVVLVGVVDAHGGPRDGSWPRESAADLGAVLAARAEDLEDAGGTFPVATALVEGDVATALMGAVQDGDAVVIGSDKTGYAQGRIYGIRSIQLAAIAPGVLVVVPIVDLRLRTGVVVAVDHPAHLEQLVRVAAREAVRTSAPLLLVHAVPQNAGAAEEERAAQLLVRARELATGEPGVRNVVSHLLHRQAADAILSLSRDRALLVVGASRNRGVLGVGRTLHDLLTNLNVPIVVLPRV